MHFKHAWLSETLTSAHFYCCKRYKSALVLLLHGIKSLHCDHWVQLHWTNYYRYGLYLFIYLFHLFQSQISRAIFYCLDTHPGKRYTPLCLCAPHQMGALILLLFLVKFTLLGTSFTCHDVSVLFPFSDRQSEKCQRQTTDGPNNFPSLAVFPTNCYSFHK